MSDGIPGSGGFITFPGGQFVVDPASQVTVPGPGARTSFGMSYDLGYHRWLPVPWDWITPDGSKYVYATPTTVVVVSVVTGAIIREFGKEYGGEWWPLDTENGGVYAYQVVDDKSDPPPESGMGLWLFPFPATEQAHAVPGSWADHLAVRGSILYTSSQWSYPHTPNTGGLYRQDLNDGGVITLIDAGNPGDSSSEYIWVGAAADNVFVIRHDGQLWVFHGASQTPSRLDLGGDTPFMGSAYAYSIESGRHGTWIAGNHGLYLLTAQGVDRASDQVGVLAGGCT